MKVLVFILALTVTLAVSGCGAKDGPQSIGPPIPSDIIDLGALVTADLPQRVWGKAQLSDRGWYEQQNSFQLLPWTRETPEGRSMDQTRTTPFLITVARMWTRPTMWE